jgi:transposase-like protein/ribosomal protein L37AE/L43A
VPAPDYPQTIIEFRERFATEEACEKYLVALRWPDGFVCPQCGTKKAWEMQRGLYWCRCCGYQASVTAGTLFHDTHKPLRLWFEAMWYVTSQKSGVSALGLQRVLGLGSYHTAWNWLHKLRRAMVRPGRDRLSGVVEVDEIFIGGERSGKRGRGSEWKALVVIAAQAAEKGIGRIRMRRVVDAAGESLEPAVWEMVEPGNVVRTDGWRGYNGLTGLGYQHQVVSKQPDLGDNLLPLVNRVASLLKRWLLGTHQGAVQHSHLEYYLDEYTFRFNRRSSKSRGLLFYRLISQAIDLGPVLESELKTLKSAQKPQESTA